MKNCAGIKPLSGHALRIVKEAARLFAKRGFDGITTREIASACGINIATMHYHVGTKRQLYKAVCDYFASEEQSFIAAMLDHVSRNPISTPDQLPSFLMNVIDLLLEFWRQNPLRLQFYMRHWLDAPDEEAPPFDTEDGMAIYRQIEVLLREAQQQGKVRLNTGPALLLRGLYMLIYSYFVSGAFDLRIWRGDPYAPENLAEFKGFLHEYLWRMLGLSEA